MRRARGSGGGAVFGGRGFDAFVEDHGDVRTERLLDFDGAFGREEMLGAVQVRAEGTPSSVTLRRSARLNT